MRAAAAWFLDQRTLPRHESLKLWSKDLTDFVEHLAFAVDRLAASLPVSDAPGRVAMVGVGEARRRLDEPEAAGLNGETERVKRLARSVVALCDHHDALAGARMCLACDKPIEDGHETRPATRPGRPRDPAGHETRPYDNVSPSGGARVSGRIHVACASTGRPQR
ncbi:DUF6415 family natural product biosynthesis protein [Streptomyces chartreusis]|uniref:DUF6415 family natural product biosynthesis protein n=1 Tax=Streptomyces chartreusis TaxID=1969 RepID=UPI0037FC4CD4